MGPGRHAILFKAAYRLTVLLALGVSTGCLRGGNPESSGGSGSAWTTKTSMPTPRTALAVGVIGNILYAVGGNSGGTDLNTVEAYDPTFNKWFTKKSMKFPRSGLAVGVVDGILYAIGGDINSTTVEAYDPGTGPGTDSWTTKTSMPTPRYGSGAGVITGVGVINGLIYVVGGVIAPGVPGTVDVYDPGMDKWTTMSTTMPTERIFLGVGVVNGILYAVGGCPAPGGCTTLLDNLATVEAYDPGTDKWTTEISMPTARGGLAVGVNDGILYAVGGQLPDIQQGDTTPKTLEAYNPATDTWTTLDPMPTGRTLLAAGVVNGILYAVGGDDQGTVETFTPPTP